MAEGQLFSIPRFLEIEDAEEELNGRQEVSVRNLNPA
jgi:hypothetical protein